MADGASCHACRVGQHGHEARSGAKVSMRAAAACAGQWAQANGRTRFRHRWRLAARSGAAPAARPG
eukprot:scaffold40172_cov58-Phaeocystis_antarctica.AAC.2